MAVRIRSRRKRAQKGHCILSVGRVSVDMHMARHGSNPGKGENRTWRASESENRKKLCDEDKLVRYAGLCMWMGVSVRE